MDLLTNISSIVSTVVDRMLPDQTKAAEIKLEVMKSLHENHESIVQAASNVMVADAQSDSWLARNMRPIIVLWMLLVMTGIFIEALVGDTLYIISAIARIPDQMWNMVMVGGFGYMALRSGEKIADTITRRKS